LKRSLAVGGVLAIVGASVVMGMGSAQAAAGITVSPHTNIKNGQAVKVVGHGYTPGAQIAMGECPKGVTASGPGYCASQTSGGSYLAVAKSDGTVSQTLYMTVGPLHNTSGAPATCDATHPCLIEVENISKHSEYAAVALQFAGAEKAAATPTPTHSSDPPATTLPHTGASGVVITALIGFVLLQVGLVAAVRATRSAPRRLHM
jgi:hypothetical protein